MSVLRWEILVYIMEIKEILDKLENFAPLDFQEPYDNSGLQVGNPYQPVTSVLLTVDVTEGTVDEAVTKGANLIISHHPLIFNALKKITGQNYIERTVIKALKHNIVIYSAHTNLDKIIGGVSYKMAEKLLLQNVRILHPENEFCGLGCIGQLPTPENTEIFLARLKTIFNLTAIRHSQLVNRRISKVAVCGGSGAEFISDAIRQHADIYITADIKYHQFFLADNQIIIADIGHYESEQFTKEIFNDQLIGFFPNFAIHVAQSGVNPVCLF